MSPREIDVQHVWKIGILFMLGCIHKHRCCYNSLLEIPKIMHWGRNTTFFARTGIGLGSFDYSIPWKFDFKNVTHTKNRKQVCMSHWPKKSRNINCHH